MRNLLEKFENAITVTERAEIAKTILDTCYARLSVIERNFFKGYVRIFNS